MCKVGNGAFQVAGMKVSGGTDVTRVSAPKDRREKNDRNHRFNHAIRWHDQTDASRRIQADRLIVTRLDM